MKCLCCNREIDNPTEYESEVMWHASCIKRFFATDRLPELSVTEEELQKLANSTVSKGLTVPGVQKKLSLHLGKEDKVDKLTIVDYPTGYILKPQSAEYTALPEMEFLVMEMADTVGIKTVPSALMRIDGEYVYITKRVDRIKKGLLAMEDFCQLSGRMTADKYKSSYEKCAEVIKNYSTNPGLDGTELLVRLLFCFVTGNSDMHLKNFSLIERAPGLREYILSPAYDLLPVNIVMPADKDQTALTLNGKKRNIRKKDFLELSKKLMINEKAAANLIRRTAGYKDLFCDMIQESIIPEEYKAPFAELVRKRCEIIG